MAKKTSAPSPAKLLAALREGPAAVQAWNLKVAEGPKKFRKANLVEAKLSHVVLAGLDFTAAVFDQATLYQAHLEGTILADASFKKANLKSARFDRAKLEGADLSEADLSKANLTCANLQRANLTGAKLDKADLAFADLRGADLTSASLTGANLMGISTDTETKLPAGMTPPASAASEAKSPAKSGGKKQIDLPSFMKELADKSDPGRFERALKMLKSGKIQLFTDVTPEHVVGVVQSQSRDDTVYSCHLRSDGKFACVTTDLENCMGLGEGKPCKHLLVLLVGLVHSGQFDPGTAMLWVSTKAKKGTRKDTNVLADTLIRYKGALAGEVDWRPTETLPEDFYAF